MIERKINVYQIRNGNHIISYGCQYHDLNVEKKDPRAPILSEFFELLKGIGSDFEKNGVKVEIVNEAPQIKNGFTYEPLSNNLYKEVEEIFNPKEDETMTTEEKLGHLVSQIEIMVGAK